MDNLDDPREEADGYELPGLSLPTKFALLVLLAAVVALVFATTGVGNPMFNDTNSPAAQEACQDEFGDGWKFTGWMGGNPPLLLCKGPNGEDGYMDMPEPIADEFGVRAAAYEDGGQ